MTDNVDLFFLLGTPSDRYQFIDSNGKLYAACLRANHPIVIWNPLLDTGVELAHPTSVLIPGGTNASAGWGPPILAPNGSIYQAPRISNFVGRLIRIDTNDDTIHTIDMTGIVEPLVSSGAATNTYNYVSKGVLAGDYIYWAPYVGSQIIKLNWTNNTVSSVNGHAGAANTLSASPSIDASGAYNPISGLIYWICRPIGVDNSNPNDVTCPIMIVTDTDNSYYYVPPSPIRGIPLFNDAVYFDGKVIFTPSVNRWQGSSPSIVYYDPNWGVMTTAGAFEWYPTGSIMSLGFNTPVIREDGVLISTSVGDRNGITGYSGLNLAITFDGNVPIFNKWVDAGGANGRGQGTLGNPSPNRPVYSVPGSDTSLVSGDISMAKTFLADNQNADHPLVYLQSSEQLDLAIVDGQRNYVHGFNPLTLASTGNLYTICNDVNNFEIVTRIVKVSPALSAGWGWDSVPWG